MSIWKRCLHTVQVGHLSGQLGKKKGSLGCDRGQPVGQCCLRGCVAGVGTNPHLSGAVIFTSTLPTLRPSVLVEGVAETGNTEGAWLGPQVTHSSATSNGGLG